MKSLVIGSSLLLLSSSVWAGNINPSEMPPEAQKRMYEIVTEYNKCMTQSRLSPESPSQSGQDHANTVMQQCEAHLDGLKIHLADNNVADNFANGMTNAFRSRAARQLMTQTMNSMAAQAPASASANRQQQ